MTHRRPQYCRREAFDYFAEQLPVLHRTDGLCRAAIALSMHELEDLHPQNVEQQLWTIAGRVADRVQSDNPEALLAHLHEELFEQMQLRGDQETYFTPQNSYLSCVLERGLGIPISLWLVYKAVAERVGLRVVGINAPGHFMVGVAMPKPDNEPAPGATTLMLVDPFFGGRVLTPREAAARVAQIVAHPVPDDPASVLPTASHDRWLSRMLLNLEQIHEQQGDTHALRAMLELRTLLESATHRA